MKKRNFLNIIKAILSIIIILFLLSKVNFKIISQINFKNNIEYFIVSVFSFLFSLLFVQTLRLKLIIKKYDYSFYNSFKLIVISSFFNSFLPSNIGGDGYKVLFLKKKYNLSLNKAFSLIFIERLSGLLVLFLMGVFYIIFFWKRLSFVLEKFNFEINNKLYYIFAVILLLFIIILILFFIKREWSKKILKKVLSNIKSAINFIISIKNIVYLKIILYSIVIHFFRLIGFYYLIIFFNSQINLIDLIFVLSVTAFVSMLPITIGALGLREGTISIMLILFGVSGNEAIIIALLNRIILLFIALIGTYFYYNNNIISFKKNDTTA
ncbi:MAG: flippase-like domain-containing protein [Bacteroidales bacterium]|nr:flippase-like domain-containing protein [Bacteroidales bacterium]